LARKKREKAEELARKKWEKAEELARKKRKTPTSTNGSSASKREKFSGKNYVKFLVLHIMSLNNQCIK
jgi:hypothetical protein